MSVAITEMLRQKPQVQAPTHSLAYHPAPQLVDERDGDENPAPAPRSFGPGHSFGSLPVRCAVPAVETCPLRLQPKLAIGQPDDQRAVDIEKIRESLTGGFLDWVTEQEVREVLSMLRPLSDVELRHVLASMEAEQLVDAIFTNVSPEDTVKEKTLLERVRRLRPAKTLFLEYLKKEKKICQKPIRGGWQIIDSFRNLEELIGASRVAAKEVLISRLGILAHGDMGGVLNIGSTVVTIANIDRYASNIAVLSGFLTSDAVVYIFGCITGVGRAGSAFLKEWSLLLPGRMIVGFNELTTPAKGSQVGSCFLPEIATTGRKAELGEIDKRTAGLMADEHNPAAKIAKDGRIIKWPLGEQKETDDGTKESTRKYFVQ